MLSSCVRVFTVERDACTWSRQAGGQPGTDVRRLCRYHASAQRCSLTPRRCSAAAAAACVAGLQALCQPGMVEFSSRGYSPCLARSNASRVAGQERFGWRALSNPRQVGRSGISERVCLARAFLVPSGGHLLKDAHLHWSRRHARDHRFLAACGLAAPEEPRL